MSEIRARLRELRRNPGYVTAVLLSLVLGMATCISVFSVVNTLVFAEIAGIVNRPGLARIAWSNNQGLTPAEFDLLETIPSHAFVSLAAHGDRRIPVMLPSGPMTVTAGFVSRHFFETMGTKAVHGRLLLPRDDESGAAPVVVLAEPWWLTAFAGSKDAIGQSITIAHRTFTIVGIAPAGFPGLASSDVGRSEAEYPQVWLPLQFDALWGFRHPTNPFLAVAGRLIDPGALSVARAEMAVVENRFPPEVSSAGPPRRLRVRRDGLDWRDAPGEALLVLTMFLFVPVGILAIGCVNVINLQLARAFEMAAELRVRIALGASPLRIMRLLAMEVVPLSILAGSLGWAVAEALLRAVESRFPVRFDLDHRALVFGFAVVVGTVWGAGGVPAWIAVRDLAAPGLGNRSGSAPHSRLRNGLVIVQVAGSVALLTLSALAIRTWQTQAPLVPPDAHQILIAEFNLADVRPDDPRSEPFVETVSARLAGESSVRSAGFSSFFAYGYPIRYWLPSESADAHHVAFGGPVTQGWFDATHSVFLTGRGFHDAEARAPEIVINRALASSLSGDVTSALGASLRVGSATAGTMEVVGVVADTTVSADGRPVPMMMLPMPATPPSSLVLTARVRDLEAGRLAIAAAVAQADPAVPFARLEPLDVRVQEMFKGFRELTLFAVGMGGVGLLLSGAGLYALLAYTVRRRAREIGIRVALGATPRAVLTLTLRVAVTLVLVGGLLGVMIATPVAMMMRSVLLGVSPLSPWAILPTMAVLLIVASLASLIPALRAVRVDPLTALREQ